VDVRQAPEQVHAVQGDVVGDADEPDVADLIWNRQIDPGKVFDLQLPLREAAAGYRAMDQREAIKALLRP
jgi:threonine dehydrogenase-like Zn-dependent dehydrogenase